MTPRTAEELPCGETWCIGYADSRCKYLAPNMGCPRAMRAERDALVKAGDALEKACDAFVKFAELPGNTVTRDQYIGYQVSAIGGARDGLAAWHAARGGK